jgi:hypothetical protein
MGPTPPFLTQTDFRGRDDDVGINVDTWNGGGGLNGDWTQDTDTNFRIRIAYDETNDVGANKNWGFQYNLAGGGWNDIIATSPIQYSDSPNFAAFAPTSQLITSGGSYVNGDGCDTRGYTQRYSIKNEISESEICLQIDSAQVTDGQTFQVRINNWTDTADLDQYDNTPTITINEPAAAARRVFVIS